MATGEGASRGVAPAGGPPGVLRVPRGAVVAAVAVAAGGVGGVRGAAVVVPPPLLLLLLLVTRSKWRVAPVGRLCVDGASTVRPEGWGLKAGAWRSGPADGGVSC